MLKREVIHLGIFSSIIFISCIFFLFQEQIVKASNDKEIMDEQRHQLEQEIKQWEQDFKDQNGREPTEGDR